MRSLRPALALTLTVAAPAAGIAQTAQTSYAPSQPELVFSLRGGVAVTPEYFGSDDYSAGPDLGFKFHGLTLRSGKQLGDGDPWADAYGWDLHGSFRYIGERDASDHDDLRGMEDVDAALELGLGFGYTAEHFSAFTDLRRGFGGHESWVGEAGLDLIARPNDRWKLTLGPRLFWGSDGYADTYFGVDASEATATRPAFDAGGGLLSTGLEMGARYQINNDWGLEGALTWETYQNDAADSPIVDSGSEDQWTIRFGVTRVVRLRF
ncbi:MipA/OmpV family protein [Salipiger sp. P9]|uniref:MipA/OmpV family protein n=1 Tax=Salipiger pentaromativorans TaxID=2943193 RepID=UPI002157FBF8|nr:MipA/OmpV family protein [Salipiger pentaromativorans]MCR8550847.1 MipA/OmpV family protein [Salipiger pentaromativorans]